MGGAGRALLPFLNVYRTMCLAPEPAFGQVLEDMRDLEAAAAGATAIAAGAAIFGAKDYARAIADIRASAAAGQRGTHPRPHSLGQEASHGASHAALRCREPPRHGLSD